MKELKRKKDELVTQRKVYHELSDDLGEQLETWEELKEKIGDGEEVFEPVPKAKKKNAGSKKRKRGAKSNGRSKKAKGDNGEMDDFIVTTDSDDSDENEESEKENSEEILQGPPLTEDIIRIRIAGIKEQRKGARAEAREISSQIAEVQDDFEEVKDRRLRLRNRIATYCIKARNEYSTKAIKQDFAAGLHELDMEAAEKEDAANFDPTQRFRDYNEIAEQLPVFCVSSRGYQKLQGRLRRDGDPPVFSTIEQTGLPDLQSHCMRLTEKGREYGSRKFLNSLSLLFNSLSLWAVQTSQASGFRIDDQMFEQLHQV